MNSERLWETIAGHTFAAVGLLVAGLVFVAVYAVGQAIRRFRGTAAKTHEESAVQARPTARSLTADEQRFFDAVRNGDTTAVGRLLAAGMSPDVCDGKGLPALYHAVDGDQLEVVRALLKRGAGSRIRPDRMPILIFARSAMILRELLAAGADANDATELTGRTPLMTAVARNQPEFVDVLLEAGARPDLADRYGQTAFDDARGRPAILEMLSRVKARRA
jgi:hypothetical protein